MLTNDKTNSIKMLAELEEDAQASGLTPEELAGKLQTSYYDLYQLNARNSDLTALSGTDLTALQQTSFKIRLLLQEKLAGLNVKEDTAGKNLLFAVRDLTRALRYFEDYLSEIQISRDPSLLRNKFSTLSGQGSHYMMRPGEQFSDHRDLLSGDVVLSRGEAYASAAIARIGTSDSQFSHLSLVYREPDKDGRLYTIEAHIEIGAVVEPIQVHLDQKNARTVVFRFEDRELAHRAAQYMYQKVKTHSATGKNIPYDFGLQYLDSSRLFCSEVVYDGFCQASEGRLDIPYFKTKFNPKLLPFLNDLGVEATEENISELKTFAPGDLEYDPRFSLIAEWKDLHKIRDSRIKDLVLTKMFQWMENADYRIFAPWQVTVMSVLTWILRKMPLIKRKFIKKLPRHMKIRQIRLFMTIDKIGEVLKKEVLAAQERMPHPLSPKEVFELLEEFRIQDRETFAVQPKRSAFHQWFHDPG